jgi:hypothetical protein
VIKKVVIADHKGNEFLINGTDCTIVIAKTDKTLLNNTIVIAQAAYDAATEGSSVGNYILGSQAILKALIDKAQIVSTNITARQSEIDSVNTELENAITIFQNSVVLHVLTGDLNNDSVISIGDIGVMSSLAGQSTVSLDWNFIKIADLNNDGKIDVDDLTLLANMILAIFE